MANKNNLEAVIESGMCIGCGACLPADHNLELVFNPIRMHYEPSGPGNEAAAAVCPSMQVDYAGLHAKVFPGAEVSPHGVVDTVLLAQSADHGRNIRASSGGIIKELLAYYLSKDDVDGAIVLRQSAGLEFEYSIITSPDEVDELPGSIYHVNHFYNALKLLCNTNGRFVLVANPCQLEGLYAYVFKCAPDLAQRIYATVGLLCGWLYTRHSIRAICSYKGLDFDSIEDISYRGGGPVGKLIIRTPQKSASISRRTDFSYQVAFDRAFNVARCHVCVNHSNFLADVVVGDAWLPSTVYTKTGISLVVCRKPETTVVLDRMAQDGRIRAVEVTKDEITESQTRRVVFGDFAYAYAQYLDDMGEHRPEMTGPNRNEARLAPRKSVEQFHREVVRKRTLQQQRKYRFLWWRKATMEIGKLAAKYLRWFFVRVLKIKSLLRLRDEIDREKLDIFR